MAWRSAETLSLLPAGLSQYDLSSITNSTGIQQRFWFFYSGILSNSLYQKSVDPISCTGNGCYSLFFPGGLNTINASVPISLNITESTSAIVAYDVPGYQVEFYPPKQKPQFNPVTDCITENNSSTGLETPIAGGTNINNLAICLKKEDNDIIAGRTRKTSH